jgi:hypothetical protein
MMVASAARAWCGSIYLFDQWRATGDRDALMQHSRLADAAKQQLLAAHEMAVREAQGRPKALAGWGSATPVASSAPEPAQDEPAAEDGPEVGSVVEGASTGQADPVAPVPAGPEPVTVAAVEPSVGAEPSVLAGPAVAVGQGEPARPPVTVGRSEDLP